MSIKSILPHLLAVGYDDEKQVVYAHDCSFDGVQQISYIEFENSLNVNVPGISKKNTYDLPPWSDTSYNLVKGGRNGQKGVHTGTNHQ